MARYSMFGMAGIGIAAAIGFVFALSSLGNSLGPPNIGGPHVFDNGTSPTVFATATQALKKFSSVDELKSYLSNVEANRGQLESAERSFGGMGIPGSNLTTIPPNASMTPSGEGAPAQSQYGPAESTTTAPTADSKLGVS